MRSPRTTKSDLRAQKLATLIFFVALWPIGRADAQRVVVQSTQEQWPQQAVFSDDDAWVVTVDRGGRFSLVEVASGRVRATLPPTRYAPQPLGRDVSVEGLRFRGNAVHASVRGDFQAISFSWNGLDDRLEKHVVESPDPGARAWYVLHGPRPTDVISGIGPVAEVGGREFRIGSFEGFEWPVRARFAVERDGRIEIREVSNPEEPVMSWAGHGLVAHDDTIASIDDSLVTLVSMRTLDVSTFEHRGGDEASLRLLPRDILVESAGRTELLSRRRGPEPRWVDGNVLATSPRSIWVQRPPIVDEDAPWDTREWDTPVVEVRRADGHEQELYRSLRTSFAGHRATLLTIGDGELVFRRGGRILSTTPLGGSASIRRALTHETQLIVMSALGVQRWGPSGVLGGEACEPDLVGMMPNGTIGARRSQCAPDGVHVSWRDTYPSASSSEVEAIGEGGVLLLGNGVVVRGSEQITLESLSPNRCHYAGVGRPNRCDWKASFRGEHLVVELAASFDERTRQERAPEIRLFELGSGRLVAQHAGVDRITFAHDGSRYAVHGSGRGEVWETGSARVFEFGEDDGNTRGLVVFAGEQMGWTDSAGSAHVVDESGRPSTNRALLRRLETAPTERATDPQIAHCMAGRWTHLQADGESHRGPVCEGAGVARREGDRFVQIDGPLVRVYTGERVLTLGTIRRVHVDVHFVYDDLGRWWSDAPEREPLRRWGRRSRPMRGASDEAVLQALFE